jgi:hypothetical protein
MWFAMHRFFCTSLVAGCFFSLSAASQPCRVAPVWGVNPTLVDLRNTFELASRNALGSLGPTQFAMTSGLNIPAREVPFHLPVAILKAVGWYESWDIVTGSNYGWRQFIRGTTYMNQNTDCGTGIMQITTGMRAGDKGTWSDSDAARIAAEPTFNVGAGAYVLGRIKWKEAPTIGNNDPRVYEHWYYALWGYHGFGLADNPLRYPKRPAPDFTFNNQSDMPYQEKIMSLVRRPEKANVRVAEDGQPLWQPVPVAQDLYTTVPNKDVVKPPASDWPGAVTTDIGEASLIGSVAILINGRPVGDSEALSGGKLRLTAQYKIRNTAPVAARFHKLTLGGRLNKGCPATCPDFTFSDDFTLKSQDEKTYTGSLEITQPGTYRFFPAYIREDGTWNLDVANPYVGVLGERTITVTGDVACAPGPSALVRTAGAATPRVSPCQAPVPFSVSARIVSTTLSAKTPIDIEATFTNTSGGALSNVIADMEVVDPAGQKVGQDFREGQSFGVDESRTYTFQWTPKTAGSFSISIAVFNAAWSSNIAWFDRILPITISSSTSATPTFTAIASAANTSGTVGQTLPISVTFTNTTSSVVNNAIADVEILDSKKNKVWQKSFEGQNFGVGEAKTFSLSWPLDTPGSYILDAAVFRADWGVNYLWRDALVLSVTPGSQSAKATFTASVTGPTSLAVGQTGHFTATFASTNAAATPGANLDVEINDPTGSRVAQKTGSFNYAGNDSTTLVFDWTPSITGNHTVKAAVFPSTWGQALVWNDTALIVAVSPSAPPSPATGPTVVCSIAPNPTDLNTATGVTATASGGSGGYRYVINGVDRGPNGFLLFMPPQQLGTFTVVVYAYDSQNRQAQSACSASVVMPMPKISGYTLDQAPKRATNFAMTVLGSGFVPGTAVYFFGAGCNPCQQPPAGVSVRDSGTINIWNIQLGGGPYYFKLMNPGGEWSGNSATFNVQ